MLALGFGSINEHTQLVLRMKWACWEELPLLACGCAHSDPRAARACLGSCLEQFTDLQAQCRAVHSLTSALFSEAGLWEEALRALRGEPIGDGWLSSCPRWRKPSREHMPSLRPCRRKAFLVTITSSPNRWLELGQFRFVASVPLDQTCFGPTRHQYLSWRKTLAAVAPRPSAPLDYMSFVRFPPGAHRHTAAHVSLAGRRIKDIISATSGPKAFGRLGRLVGSVYNDKELLERVQLHVHLAVSRWLVCKGGNMVLAGGQKEVPHKLATEVVYRLDWGTIFIKFPNLAPPGPPSAAPLRPRAQGDDHMAEMASHYGFAHFRQTLSTETFYCVKSSSVSGTSQELTSLQVPR